MLAIWDSSEGRRFLDEGGMVFDWMHSKRELCWFLSLVKREFSILVIGYCILVSRHRERERRQVGQNRAISVDQSLYSQKVRK